MRVWIILVFWSVSVSVSQAATLNWHASSTPNVDGYVVYLGEASQTYTRRVPVGAAVRSYPFGPLTPGVRYFTAVTAYNRAGESAYSNELSWVEGQPLPTPPGPEPPLPVAPVSPTPPQVAIISPATGESVAKKQTTTITVMAVDDGGVASVRVYVNDTLRCTDDTVPYTCAWRVPNTRNTFYRLKAQATDQTGHVGESPVIRVKTP